MLFSSHKKAVSIKERGGFILLHCCSRCAFFERKNKMKTKKHRLLALALISSFTLLGAASAAVQYPDGGVWTYGEGSGGGWAFSNYYHGKKYHYSSIVSRWDGHSDKGEAPAGKTSYAWIWTKWGEQVAFYCDYD